jgi:hypothetical protein
MESTNEFTGSIPRDITHLSSIHKLDISINDFNGIILTDPGLLRTKDYLAIIEQSTGPVLPRRFASIIELSKSSLYLVPMQVQCY